MERICIIANDFFKKCGIKNLPISQDKINEIVKLNGWELRYYSTSKSIIKRLELEEYAKTHNGFTYTEDDSIIIFVRDELNYLEKINVICHEIGHIVLGHTSCDGILGKSKDKNYENILEKEANTFSMISVHWYPLPSQSYLFQLYFHSPFYCTHQHLNPQYIPCFFPENFPSKCGINHA